MFSRRTAWDLTTNRYTEALTRYRQSGQQLLDLTASNPTTVGLSFDTSGLLNSLAKPESLAYQPIAKGLPVAREAVAGYYATKGISIDPDNLILTTSTSEAYSFVFRLLCDPGDSMLVPVPSYPLFDFLADLNDVQLVPYELVYDHGWQIDFSSLQSSLRGAAGSGSCCRAVLVVNPNNPTGSFAKPEEAARLAEFCNATDMALIADEVFLDYRLSETPPYSFVSCSDTSTFTLSGLSKIAALPQMKVAWVATTGPDPVKSEALARLELISDTYLSMNGPLQLALPRMLEERLRIQPQIMERVQANLLTLDTQLAAHSSCQRLALEGGWNAVLRVPALCTDEELAVMLLQATGVLLQPGHFYNFPSDGFLVASLITPRHEFEEGIARALAFVANR
jgi:alanine-synthesizing transaminase